MPRSKRLLATIPAVALLGAALSTPPAAATSVANYQPTASDYYINYAPPAVPEDTKEPALEDARSRSLTPAQKFDRKFNSGNPVTGRILAAREEQAMRTGRNPAEWIFKNTKQTRTAKLLTVLVEFNEQANDDFSGFNRLRSTQSGSDDCVVEPRARC
ncbi:hypothetical protein ACFQQB_03940 [Nonomuraea rubra]|uniref:hypothetical protein n=1 Tax=Nonomuraea rubra TaxID=46180 RepID=UPI0036211AA0